MANIKGVTHQGEVVDLGTTGIASQVDLDDQPAADLHIDAVKKQWEDKQRVEQGVAFVAVDGHAVPVSAHDTETHEEKAQRLLNEGAFPEPTVATTGGPKPLSEINPVLSQPHSSAPSGDDVTSNASYDNSKDDAVKQHNAGAESAGETDSGDENASSDTDTGAEKSGEGETETQSGPKDLSGLDASIVRALAQSGVTDIEQLRGLSDSQLLGITGIKSAGVRTIRAYLG